MDDKDDDFFKVGLCENEDYDFLEKRVNVDGGTQYRIKDKYLGD